VLALAAVQVGCGSGQAGKRAVIPLAAEGIDAQLGALRVTLAQDPTDAVAHRRLGLLLVQSGQPGGAIRHLARALAGGTLSRAERAQLAALYRARARQRLAMGDGYALADVRRADAIAGPGPRELRVAALRAQILAQLQSAAPEAEIAVRRAVRALAAVAPDDSLLAIADPGSAPLPKLGSAAAWVFEHGAPGAGYRLLEDYVRRGGRDGRTIESWLRAQRWWQGDHARLSPLLIRRALQSRADLCSVAVSPDSYGCGEAALFLNYTEDGARSELLRQRARTRQWRTAQPALAAVMVAVALRGWALAQEPAWLAAVAELVDLQSLGLAGAERAPLFARPTLLRALGEPQAAAEALARAAASAATLSPGQRAVLLAEASARAVDLPEAEQLAQAIAAAGAVQAHGWIAAAAAARAAGDAARERYSLDQDGPLAARYLAGHGALAAAAAHLGNRPEAARYRLALQRWYRALDEPVMVAARDALVGPTLASALPAALASAPPAALGLGDVDVAAIALGRGLADADDLAGLVTVAAGFRRDPALVDRLARAYLDGNPSAGRRGPALVDLLIRLGAGSAAMRWAQVVLDESPRHHAHLFLAAQGAVAAGQVERADALFIDAAAALGDPAASEFAAARFYMQHQHYLAAIGAGRRSLEQSPAGSDRPVLWLLAEATLAAGRFDDAERVLVRWVGRAQAPFRAAAHEQARRLWRALTDRPVPGELAAEAETGDAEEPARATRVLQPGPVDCSDPQLAMDLAAAVRQDQPDRARQVLAYAQAWSPGQVAVRRARLHLLRPDSAEYAAGVAELAAIAAFARGADRQAALATVAESAPVLGAHRLAALARAELALTPEPDENARRIPGQ
jgi:hypothetical protein